VVVIDASVYVSRLRRQEVHHIASVRLLETVAAREVTVLCPEILLPEVAAALGDLIVGGGGCSLARSG